MLTVQTNQTNDTDTIRVQMEKHERLRHARMKAQFPSASAAAESLGVSISTYASHENGNRNFNAEDAAKYARRFGVTAEWLLFGTGSAGSPDRPDTDETSELQLVGLDIEDEEEFREAYKDAREIEQALIGGRGPRMEFAKMVSIIYRERLAEKKARQGAG